MGLDYTDGCVNFRDVGGYINLILGAQKLKEQMLFRGGSIDYVNEHQEIKSVQSIINLRNGADGQLFNVDYYHFPMTNKVEKYHTAQKEVQVWLNSIIKIFESPAIKYPILVHCLSGKDRTGIVIATILAILGIEQEIIVEEYMLSMGEVKQEWILQALEGIQDLNAYFNRINLVEVRKNLKDILLVL